MGDPLPAAPPVTVVPPPAEQTVTPPVVQGKAETNNGKSEKSKMFKCKVYGDCPKGMTDEATEKYPEHGVDYNCKVYGKCDGQDASGSAA